MQFNSPKNFKRGRLVNNRYRKLDLLIGLGGALITIGLIISYLVIFQGKNFVIAGLLLIPALIAVTLIQPYGIYHNFLVYLQLFIVYSNIRKNWIWEGIYKYELEQAKE